MISQIPFPCHGPPVTASPDHSLFVSESYFLLRILFVEFEQVFSQLLKAVMFHHKLAKFGKRKIYVFLMFGSILGSVVLILEYIFESVGNGCSSTIDTTQLYEWDQKNPCLAEYIRDHYLLPPSNQSYNLFLDANKHANAFSRFVTKIFPNKVNGTFVEVGAYDGEEESNTLWLELQGWTGLLIECNPVTLPKLLGKHRKAWIAQTCLSTIGKPQMVNFTTLKDWPASAQLWKPLSKKEMKRWHLDKLKDTTWHNYTLPAFPLYSILKGTREFNQIDFLSLDVQGIELQVLRNFPFEHFDIKVIVAEINVLSKEDLAELKWLMASNGYNLTKKFQYDMAWVRHV